MGPTPTRVSNSINNLKLQITNSKLIKLFSLFVFVIILFALGIFLEKKIKENVNIKKVVVEDVIVKSDKERVLVSRVIDGDTVELSDKRKVRYIGINSPEMTDKRAEVLCFAKMAKAKNEKMVLNKTIELEKDVSDKDKYGRLLRYVWIDGEMVNLNLIKNGFAKIATYPPDVKYKDLFLEADKTAKKLICNKI